MFNNSRKVSLIYLALPMAAAAFCILYILLATKDVVYTDYIRIINSYLPDVFNPRKFFVPDVLTRIPINYLERMINVSIFNYSVTFELMLGALSLGLGGIILGRYCRRRGVGIPMLTALMIVWFSLNKWEMLTNGTGWSHFLAVAFFLWHESVWDRVYARAGKSLSVPQQQMDQRDRKLLVVLPWITTLLLAGPYCASYSVIFLLTYGFCLLRTRQREGKWDQRYLTYGLCVLIPLLLYTLSKHFSVEVHAGATGRSLGQVLSDNAGLFPKFMIKGFSSMVVEQEVLMALLKELDRGMGLAYLLGGLVLLAYLLAFFLQFYYRLYETSILPLMLTAGGGLNHLLVLASRWIFERSDYGMSSRYALQYQIGIVGIFLTFWLFFRQVKGRRKAAVMIKGLAVAVMVAVTAGNLYSSVKELEKAHNRKEYAAKVEQVLLNYRQVDDQELTDVIQYRHGADKIRNALGILEAQGWNVYGGQQDESSTAGGRPGYQN